jgi:hypothetical protein
MVTECGCRTVAVEQALAIELAESGEELVAEHGAQCRNRQQEQRVAGRDPSPVVGRQSTGGDDAVEVIMAEQVLAPGVQKGEDPILAPSRLDRRPPRAGSGNWPRTAGRRNVLEW